jgi:hypothetical protein
MMWTVVNWSGERMLKAKDGTRLYRKVRVTIFFPPDVLKPKTLNAKSGPGQGFNPDGVDDVLQRIADQLDNLYPFWEFRPVLLRAEGRTARYNFVFAGYRDVKAPETVLEPGVRRVLPPVSLDELFAKETTPTESTTPGPGTAGSELPINIEITGSSLV